VGHFFEVVGLRPLTICDYCNHTIKYGSGAMCKGKAFLGQCSYSDISLLRESTQELPNTSSYSYSLCPTTYHSP